MYFPLLLSSLYTIFGTVYVESTNPIREEEDAGRRQHPENERVEAIICATKQFSCTVPVENIIHRHRETARLLLDY
jgi:hypothetical protein